MAASQRDKALDGLRCLAVTAVLLMHLFPAGINASRLINFGWVGVDLFFVISGFLITRACWNIESKRALVSFWTQRILRTMPALLILVLAVWVSPFAEFQDAKDYLSSYGIWFILGFQNVLFALVHPEPTWIGHLWSLGAELQFYIVWPLILIFIPKSLRLCIAVSGLVLAVVLRLTIEFPFGAYSSYRFTLTHMDGLMGGAILAGLIESMIDAPIRRLIFHTLAWAGVCSLVALYIALPENMFSVASAGM